MIPQGIKMADEYKFVTGGRPEMYIRAARAIVWITNPTPSTQIDARESGPCQNTHDSITSTNASRYSSMQRMKGSIVLKSCSALRRETENTCCPSSMF